MGCFIIFIVCLYFQLVLSVNNPSIQCSACLLIVNEMEEIILKADPNEKIESGSYRLAPDGQQNLVKTSYARSELHLMEKLENICGNVHKYGYSSKNSSGKMHYMPKEWIPTGKDKITDELTRKLSEGCEDFIDEYHDDILMILRKENKEVFKDLCHVKTNVCSLVDVGVFSSNKLKEEL
uniref:DUF3456 domain-containing protein n=1 Tax=Strongyloides papillosus TaxID=174720 RepID=A0A0N5B803_STREA